MMYHTIKVYGMIRRKEESLWRCNGGRGRKSLEKFGKGMYHPKENIMAQYFTQKKRLWSDNEGKNISLIA
jgi:hypothetical protein